MEMRPTNGASAALGDLCVIEVRSSSRRNALSLAGPPPLSCARFSRGVEGGCREYRVAAALRNATLRARGKSAFYERFQPLIASP
jgi:hypothetical protein